MFDIINLVMSIVILFGPIAISLTLGIAGICSYIVNFITEPKEKKRYAGELACKLGLGYTNHGGKGVDGEAIFFKSLFTTAPYFMVSLLFCMILGDGDRYASWAELLTGTSVVNGFILTGVFVYGLMLIARMTFRVKTKLDAHISDPNAHKEK